MEEVAAMAGVSTYLFLPGTTEEAFEFYRSVFGTEFAGPGLMRFADAPGSEDMPAEQAQSVMHVGLPILGDHMLMGTDNPETQIGDSVTIMLLPDSREEADDLFAKLSEGGSNIQPMADMFWGDYWGSFTDRYGIGWQIDVSAEQAG
jgi:PhnB protein